MSLKFKVVLSHLAIMQVETLIGDPAKKAVAKVVIKSLKLMQENLRHPSLNTHKFDEIVGPKGEEVFESYAQNKTPGAYRIFWYYGPPKGTITIIAITPHP
jgi:hypothetical protein